MSNDIIEMIPALPESENNLPIFNSLPDKHKMFVEEYVLYPNATKAYQKAFPDSSYESANCNVVRLLKDEKIQAAIVEVQKLNQKRYNIGKDYIVAKLLELTEAKAHSTRLKALDQLSKVLGLSQQKVSVEGIEPVTVVMSLPAVLPQITSTDSDTDTDSDSDVEDEDS